MPFRELQLMQIYFRVVVQGGRPPVAGDAAWALPGAYLPLMQECWDKARRF